MTPPVRRVVPMAPDHATEVLSIYGEGIATGHATLETVVPSWEEWDAAHAPSCLLVALEDGAVTGWAALSPVSGRSVYGGVAEVSLYVAASHRGRGIGRLLLSGLVAASEEAGFWTLQAGIFPENATSLRLHAAAGFRRVGVRERIGRMPAAGRGERWRDVVLLERRSNRVHGQ